jgi:hypothetical protein
MKSFFKKKFGWVVFAVAVLFLIFLYRSYQVNRVVYALIDKEGFIPRPETYTELYFTDGATNLPKKISKGDNISLSFMVHNAENRPMSYPYEVLLTSQGATSTLLLSGGTVDIAEGERKSMTVHLKFLATPPYSVISVRLTQSGKEIRFHVND